MPTVGSYTVEQYVNVVKDFHGTLAPGMLAGGFMIDLARRNLPEGELLDAISETISCLLDTIQILTPCTIGNGWLRIIDTGRSALTLFEKYGGSGARSASFAAFSGSPQEIVAARFFIFRTIRTTRRSILKNQLRRLSRKRSTASR